MVQLQISRTTNNLDSVTYFSLGVGEAILCTLGCYLLDEKLLIDFLKHKPEHLEVVMTGRNPSPELLELAEYVSEVCKRKHPFDKGIPAREGIEK